MENQCFQEIEDLYHRLKDSMSQKWQRDLPFPELLFDRWERASSLKFGEGTSIYHHSYVYGDVRVGHHTWIGPNTVLDGSGGLEIGNYCSISAGVQIYSHNSVKWAVSGGKLPYEHNRVLIGNCCFIGPQSIIKNGVTIGDHVVVGPLSFVNKDVPSFSIVAGNPATSIGRCMLQDSGEVTFEFFPGPKSKNQPCS